MREAIARLSMGGHRDDECLRSVSVLVVVAVVVVVVVVEAAVLVPRRWP